MGERDIIITTTRRAVRPDICTAPFGGCQSGGPETRLSIICMYIPALPDRVPELRRIFMAETTKPLRPSGSDRCFFFRSLAERNRKKKMKKANAIRKGSIDIQSKQDKGTNREMTQQKHQRTDQLSPESGQFNS
jgi:hypothetical protein